MDELIAPFFWIEGHDFEAYETMDRLARSVEIYDVDSLDFLDSRGTRMLATTKSHAVTGFLVAADAPNDSLKLESTLRYFFRTIEGGIGTYADAANRAGTLPDLIALYREYQNRPRRPGFWSRPFWRKRDGSQKGG